MRISIVTVAYNAVNTIEKTILSVIKQDYEDIEYIIIDGGSTDGTVDIIEKYKESLSFFVSESDNGMYDALAKGFNHVTGDIIAYINADDFYQPQAFAAVAEIFSKYRDVKWLTGINAIYNSRNQITNAALPYRYNSEFIQKGLYDGKWLPFIQQESTFWRKELMQYVDWECFSKLHLAGDYYLWHCFSKYAQLEIVSCIFSGFRKCKGQLSENAEKYAEEKRSFCGKLTCLDILSAVIYRVKAVLQKRWDKRIIKYDFNKECW